MSNYPGADNIPAVVDTPPTGTGEREEYTLWRSRASGGWFREAHGSYDVVTDDLAACRDHDEAVAAEHPGSKRPTYRLVKTVVREEAMEVVLP